VYVQAAVFSVVNRH